MPPTARLLHAGAQEKFEQARRAALGCETRDAGAIVFALEGLALVLEDTAGALMLEPYGLGR